MRAERGAAENTIQAYARDLLDYSGFLTSRNRDVDTAGRAEIEAYLAGLDDQGMAASTRARRLSALRQLHRFLYEEGLRPDDPAQRMTGPRRGRKLPNTLTEAEVDALLDAARAPVGDAGPDLRLICLMEVLYATGMRVSELVALPVGAVRGDPRMVLVKGKGGRERMSPLSPPARDALVGWLELRDAIEDEKRQAGGTVSPFLFPARGKAGHLSRIRFYQIIKDLSAKAGLDPKKVLSAHDAARFCNASAGEWRGPEVDPATAGPCGCLDNRDLHPMCRKSG